MADGSQRASRAANGPPAADFPLALRGYERHAVDEYVEETARLVAELETSQLRENVVQRALDEVGEQTSSILQRAHETAEEIAARSRSQAEGRIQRAEREAEIIRRDAERYSEQLVHDAHELWEERQRLIDDLRQLADEVLATADDALERVQKPELLSREDEDLEPEAAEEEAPERPADQPTVEVEAPPSQPGGEEAPPRQPAGEEPRE